MVRHLVVTQTLNEARGSIPLLSTNSRNVMRHHYLKDDASVDHWAVGSNTHSHYVLLQVQENLTQARIAMSPEQAEACAAMLLDHARIVRGSIDGNS
jgi:hypothetical protein